MRNIRTDVIGVMLIIIASGIFFGRLLYPEARIIVTPDYGRSDAWHFSFPTKYALSQSLRVGSLPLWRNDIGNGFPLFAEGQTGALFLPNLVLFRFLPAVTAYNLALFTAISTLGIGVYWWVRMMRMGVSAGLFAAITVMFSGLSMTQLTHITLLQGMSMLPVVIVLTEYVLRRASLRWAGLLGIAIGQQMYAGFPQATFLTLILSFSLVLWHSLRTHSLRNAVLWGTGIVLGLGTSAVQFLPSWEFLRASTDPSGFSPSGATIYSLPFKHLISFIAPFALGNPALGTYPPFYAFDGSIFWENTAYLGLITMCLLPLGFLGIKKRPIVPFLWCVVLGSLVLAGGKYAPTYVIFSLWPMNLFRVPSRFLWLTIISLSVIASHSIDTLLSSRYRNILVYMVPVILFLHTAQLMHAWWPYHLIEPARVWLQKPSTAEYLDGSGRVYTIGEGMRHNDIMVTHGWTDTRPYRALREGMSPDSNILWGVSQSQVYAGRFLQRPSLTAGLIASVIETDSRSATISATKLLSLFSISDILSFYPLDAPQLTPVRSTNRGDITLSQYTNPDSLPRAYLVFEATAAATVRGAFQTLTRDTFVLGNSVLLEQHEVDTHPELKTFLATRRQPLSLQKRAGRVTWTDNRHESLTLSVTTPQAALLVLTDTYYPGWQAAIDGNNTPIFAANVSQRAVVVPQGTHTVTFTYAPRALRWGILVSLVSVSVIALLMARPKRVPYSPAPKKARQHGSHRSGIQHT